VDGPEKYFYLMAHTHVHQMALKSLGYLNYILMEGVEISEGKKLL
jgi:hypothetical protein